MTSPRRVASAAILILAATIPAWAQSPPAVDASRLWLTGGGGFTTVLGDCRNCEGEPPYRHNGSLLVNAGVRINPQMDAGLEVHWVPGSDTEAGDRNRATSLLGVAQFRPWTRHGFFLKGGMGMGFVRNWIYSDGSEQVPPYSAKGLTLTYGAGWAFRRDRRVGVQFFAAQHVVTVGDLQASGFLAENVIANAWTLGASVVIR